MAVAAPWAYYNDTDDYCVQWLRNLIKAGHIMDGEVDERSIADVEAADVRGFTRCHFFAGIGGWDYALQLAGWDPGRAVWTGSCPCPPFSSAGKQFFCPQCQTGSPVPCPRRTGYFICWNCGHAWLADARHLWPELWRLIAHCRPECVIGEQVASEDGLVWLAGVQASVEILQYAFRRSDYPAAGVGAPHKRQRLWWLANADSRACGQGREVGSGWHSGGNALAGTGLGRSGDAGGLANPHGGLAGHGRLQPGGQHGLVTEDGGADGRLGDADDPDGARQRPLGIPVEPEQEAGRSRESTAWAGAEFIRCADGKARRVEPSIFPLAPGLSFRLGSRSPLEGKSRVGMLRAAGNAIVPQVAAAFISAVMQERP